MHRTLLSALPALALFVAGASAQSMRLALVADGFLRPVWAGAPPADFERLFVVDYGRISIVRDGVVDPEPFYSAGLDSGVEVIWSLAFDPQFQQNGRVILCFDDEFGDSAVAEYHVSSSDPDRIDYASKRFLFGPVLQPAPDHSFGDLAFGLDGTLFISTGDGGPQHDPLNSAQDRGGPFGKILRLDPDLPPPHVPFGNPWVADPGGLDAGWALGLRMPWRISVDSFTGDLWIADVGQHQYEEIDVLPWGSAGGANFGWRCREGTECSQLGGCDCASGQLREPVHAYHHSSGGCAVIGGHVYRGGDLPALYGRYVYTDFCDEHLRSFRLEGGVAVDHRDHALDIAGASLLTGPSSFGLDALGELLICDLVGPIWRLEPLLPEPWPEYCFGDGSGCGVCPCQNTAAAGSREGCRHAGGQGARLVVAGWPSVSADGLRFEVRGAPPLSFAALISGAQRLPQAGSCVGGGIGGALLDGLRCVGGDVRRHGVRPVDAQGRVGVTTPPWGAGSGLLTAAGFSVGQMRHFQVVYRVDPLSGCGSGQNSTQAASRVFAP